MAPVGTELDARSPEIPRATIDFARTCGWTAPGRSARYPARTMSAPYPRPAAVAGRFYPADPDALDRSLAAYLETDRPAERVRGVVAPHAGYMYSGAIAGETYARVRVPDRVVILSPNHTGLGVQRSLWSGAGWEIPGATIPVDEALRERVRTEAGLEFDRQAHLHEHAIEVHLPFLHAINPNIRIVPIVLAGLPAEDCREVGQGLARAIAATAADGEVLIVASTDMSHYLPDREAKRLDTLALQRVTAMDPMGLYETVRKHDISMCGVIPTTVTLVATAALGATRAELVRYGNSGEASGDFERVVGYAGVLIG